MPLAHGVKGTDLDQALQGAPVERAHVGAAAELLYGGVGAVLLTLAHHRLHRTLTYVLHRRHAVTQGARPLWAVFDGEEDATVVDVRGQDTYAHLFTIVDGDGHPLRMVQPGVQYGPHVLHRVVGLEVGSPVGHQGVADTVGLVEGIPSKGLDEVEHLFGHGLLEPVIDCALYEAVPLRKHQLGILLAHGLADDVGFACRVASEGLQNQQHLLLVDDDAIGLSEHVFQAGVGVRDGSTAVLAIDEAVDMFHGAGAVEGNHRRYVA